MEGANIIAFVGEPDGPIGNNLLPPGGLSEYQSYTTASPGHFFDTA